MYAYCIIEYPVKTLDKAFTYLVPFIYQDKIRVGERVVVPFGSKEVNGIVLKITNQYSEQYPLKEIISLDENFILNRELMELGKHLKEDTMCNLITAYQTMLPSALKIKTQKQNYDSFISYVVLNKSEYEVREFMLHHRGKKNDILERLLINNKILKKELDSGSVLELVRLGYVKVMQEKTYRIQKKQEEVKDKTLNDEQMKAFLNIKDSFHKSDTFLVYGVTGSGKTLLYIKLIKEVLKENKTALLLVPEISLTEQIIAIFYASFGSLVAILHSGLSNGEKYDEYVKILNHDVKIVIGTRSAIFAPLENIGIIILDEEHSDTYKQDNTPRYHARDIAKYRSEYHKCPLVLGSATPSLESMARAEKGVYHLIEMKNRARGKLPSTVIVDMGEEVKKRNFIISGILKEKIKERLENKEQTILLLNRRGFSTVINCSNCGFTYKCPHCEIALTYHKTNQTLRCHFCGYTRVRDKLCPKCGEDGLNYLGLGTEKLESIIKSDFSNARVIRMDADTTSRKGSHAKIIKDFLNQEYDILIGTQMISKGLDFPNCTLVGVVNADTTLQIPDFRSSERTFAMLNQASGRAGRGNKPGEVFIQTFNPDNSLFSAVVANDYKTFYYNEMKTRKLLKYPPYYYLVLVRVCSKDYQEASKNSTKIFQYLKRNVEDSTILLGPSTALNFKLKNIYRFSITIKYRFDAGLKKALKEIDDIYASNRNVFLEIDFNPLNL